MFSAMFKKAISQDFPVECRAMYYFAKLLKRPDIPENCRRLAELVILA